MYEINCYDSYGNTIDYLTQWDYNRKLIMYIDNYDLSYAPEVHFCNQNSLEALVVQSVVEKVVKFEEDFGDAIDKIQ